MSLGLIILLRYPLRKLMKVFRLISDIRELIIIKARFLLSKKKGDILSMNQQTNYYVITNE